MKAKEKTPKLTGAKPIKKEKNYVIIDGKKVSRTWAAMITNKATIQILDMRAVLK